MSDQEPGNACRRRPRGRLPRKEVARARKSHSRTVRQRGRENVRLLQRHHLFPQSHYVAAERIEWRSREVLAVVNGVNTRERIPLRKNVINTRGPKVFSNRLQGTAKHFGDPAKVR